jgi:hypothetical protein
LAAAGDPRDIIIGVDISTPGEPRIHAWLHGDEGGDGYREIERVAPPAASSS